MKDLAVAARAYLRAHPAYVVAAGLALAALGNLLAGRQHAALDSLTAAAGVLGLRLTVGSNPPEQGPKS